jgi:transcriptional regulator of acetoin/glycerol metabolism
VIVLPPLRRRLEEDPAELEALLQGVVQRIIGEASPELVGEILAILAEEPGRHYGWPGNVRELEQAVRRILVTRRYSGESRQESDPAARLQAALAAGSLDAQMLLAGYCALLHRRLGTYEEVARITGLDRRTVKKYVLLGSAEPVIPSLRPSRRA